MKHSWKITAILVTSFLLAQFVGLAIIHNYIDFEKSADGEIIFKELPIGERPPVQEDTSYVFVGIAILLGTGLALLLIKFKVMWLWKIWFLLAVVLSLVVAFASFLNITAAVLLAAILGGWKIFRPNVFIHTGTELFIYGGLAAIFVPLFNLWSISILLVLIAIYDAYAVWKSKYMITLAKSQAKAKVFAGLMIPYKLGKKVSKKSKRIPQKVKMAVLGGGDIGFPLIFAGVVMKEMGLWQSLVIPFFALLGLGIILFNGEDKKFYPAMPFIGAGCFLGLGVVWLLGMI